MEKFFMINENFNQIINNTLKREFNFCIVENPCTNKYRMD